MDGPSSVASIDDHRTINEEDHEEETKEETKEEHLPDVVEKASAEEKSVDIDALSERS